MILLVMDRCWLLRLLSRQIKQALRDESIHYKSTCYWCYLKLEPATLLRSTEQAQTEILVGLSQSSRLLVFGYWMKLSAFCCDGNFLRRRPIGLQANAKACEPWAWHFITSYNIFYLVSTFCLSFIIAYNYYRWCIFSLMAACPCLMA